MRNLLHRIIFLLLLNFPCVLVAQPPVLPEVSEDCAIYFGNYKCPLNSCREKMCEIVIPKDMFLQVDSIVINCGYKVVSFAMIYAEAMDAYTKSDNNKLNKTMKCAAVRLTSKRKITICEIIIKKEDSNELYRIYPISIKYE